MAATARLSRRLGRPPATPTWETRERILRAARRCFGDQGYARATNKEIAAAAGVTAAALYNHYPSKADLLVAAFVQAQDELLGLLRRHLNRAKGARARLRALLDGVLEARGRDPLLTSFLAVASLEAARDPEVAEALAGAEAEGVVDLLREIVSEGQRAGDLRRDLAADGVVRMLVATLTGIAQAAARETDAEHAGTLAALEALVDGSLTTND